MKTLVMVLAMFAQIQMLLNTQYLEPYIHQSYITRNRFKDRKRGGELSDARIFTAKVETFVSSN